MLAAVGLKKDVLMIILKLVNSAQRKLVITEKNVMIN